jgi:hypothetical protein
MIHYPSTSPLNDLLYKKMTFFDGTDFNNASDKDYSLCDQKQNENYSYTLSERKEENFYKELVLWQTDLKTGQVASQQIVPRKIFYFDDRIRFKNIGVTAQALCNKKYYTLVLEDDGNAKKTAEDFDFQDFSRQKNLWGGNLVSYCLKENGNFEKKIVYKNNRFDYVPLIYSSNQDDFIFYLNDGGTEKFGIFNLNTF